MAADELGVFVSPVRAYSRQDVLSRPSPVPAKDGVVGISPDRPPGNGRPASSQSLLTRIKYHYTGNAEGSTLRKTLGCLLAGELGITLRRVGSGNRMTFVEGEQVLSAWMAENAYVTWMVRPRPWELEHALIAALDVPLNLQGNQHNRFHPVLTGLRARCVARARELIAVADAGASAAEPGAAQPPQRAAPGRSGHLAGFWSAVGYADVVRAIDEYDRLGQDRFLAEHGFGRATAYLLTYRGRSYDSKAILGVAYKSATGVRISPHDFNGGVSGAAGVLRRLGFEVRDTRIAAGKRIAADTGPATPPIPRVPLVAAAHRRRAPVASLDGVDPRRSLLIVTCSGRKETGGRPSSAADEVAWPSDLQEARRRVLATANADTAHVLPAWRRYTGTFYQHARPVLADAVAAGHVVIISGGYGLARAEEPIGWYDKVLQLTDWPAGLLETALIGEAQRCGTPTVVAFASATTDYAALLRRTRWQQAGIDARLITITGVTTGAMAEVPRRLGQAFSAFWNHDQSSYPPGTAVEQL
jgi:hypothetical protein